MITKQCEDGEAPHLDLVQSYNTHQLCPGSIRVPDGHGGWRWEACGCVHHGMPMGGSGGTAGLLLDLSSLGRPHRGSPWRRFLGVLAGRR